MVTILAQTCFHHPARPGHALCMSCRQVVCQECASTWDGINYCRPCLAKQRATPTTLAPALARLSALGMTLTIVALVVAVARFMARSVAQVGTWLS